MGAVILDNSYTSANNSGWSGQGNLGKTVDSPANNSNFKGITKKSIMQEQVDKLTDSALKDMLNPTTKLKSSMYGLKSFFTWLGTLSNLQAGDIITVDENFKNLAENAQLTMQQSDELEDYLSRMLDGIQMPSSGETLPSVLTSNTKSLVTSVNSLTSTFASKFDYFNNYMYGFLQYMDILTGYMNDANMLKQKQYDEAKKAKEDNAVTVGDKKMTPEEIEARKNYAMWQNYAFKTSPVSNAVLEADNVLGMTPLEIEASHRSFEVESKVYAKTPQKVFDWDNNELADIPPREARLVKDATTAIKHTDENNFELDDEDVEIATPLEISSIFGYASDAEPLKEFFNRLGGQGL